MEGKWKPAPGKLWIPSYTFCNFPPAGLLGKQPGGMKQKGGLDQQFQGMILKSQRNMWTASTSGSVESFAALHFILFEDLVEIHMSR